MDVLEECRAYLRAHGRVALERKRWAVVTISRETGAGALTVADLVANALNHSRIDDKSPLWAVFDRNLVEKVLEDHELPTALRRFMPEDVRSYLTDAVEELLGLHPSAWTLVEHTTETIARLAGMGHVILVGRGATSITARMENVLRVRLVAPLETRAQHIANFRNLEPLQAVEFIQKTDRARRRYVQRYFDADIDDPLNYDIILNTGRVGFQRAAHLIAEAVSAIERNHAASMEVHHAA